MAIDTRVGGATRADGDLVRCQAPAKINLYLHVLGHRPDGYHDIDSLIVFADISDEIEVSASSRLGLKLLGPFAHDLETTDWGGNLVILAARALAEISGANMSVALTLRKNLPVAAGIGGGSSDAAATLKALCRLWDLAISDSELHTIAKSLGADVPACLDQASVFVGGVGEDLRPAPDLPAAWLVLVNPGVPLVTAEVFRQLDPPGSVGARFDDAPRDVYAMATTLAARSNDLEAVAIGMVPQIAGVIDALKNSKECLLARMSGSGTTCFGLFADESAARSAAVGISGGHSSWWVKTGHMLGSGKVQ